MMTRQCVFLVGGLGTRLGEVAKATPKPLLPIDGVPFLEVLLREAARRGFNHIVLLAGHRSDVIDEYLRQSGIAEKLHISIDVSIEPKPLGTAGALKHAASLLAEEFLLLNGDTWFDFNWLDLAYHAGKSGCRAGMALREISNPDRYETVELKGSFVSAFRARQPALSSGLINGGVYWLTKDVLAGISSPSSLEIDVLPQLCASGAVMAQRYEGFFVDVGLPDTLASAQKSVPAQRRRPAVFLDRDGVLNKDSGYVYLPEAFTWIEGAKLAVRRFNDLGYYVFMVTNQAGIAHGFYEERHFHALKEWIGDELREEGASIDDWRYSPFHPDAKVTRYRGYHSWRKPGPGMIDDLVAHWPVDMTRSFLVGDKPSDIQAALAAGIQGYLFESGNLLAFVNEILAARGQAPRSA